MGWLSGWSYRKSHVVNSASGAGANYQVRIKAHYGSGTDSGEDVYLNSHCRTDFGDVRFTDDDGTTLLDYWMEEKVDSDYAIFWVEVADDLSSNNATIYVYYGKSDATTTSNGDNTFLLFDHFEGSTLNPNKWVSTGNVAVANSEVSIWSTGASVSKIRSLASWLYNVAVRMKVKCNDVYDETFGLRLDASPFDSAIFNRNSGGFWAQTENEGNVTTTSVTWLSDYHLYDVTWVSGKTKYYRDNSLIAQHATNVPDESLYARFATYNANTQIVMDWVAVRKYVDPEPTHGGWESEETSGGVTVAWSALLNTNHVFTRPIRFFKLSQTLNATHIFIRNRLVRLTHALQTTHVFSRPARVIRLPAALQLTHVYGRPFRFIKLLQQLGLVREYYVSKPGVKKTKLFLVLGGLAIQLSSD